MPSAADRLSTGEREVFCTRADCAHRGELVSAVALRTPESDYHHWYRCVADILIMDRRAKCGKTCARFAKRGPGASDEAAT